VCLSHDTLTPIRSSEIAGPVLHYTKFPA
jgi:hypothetical protein